MCVLVYVSINACVKRAIIQSPLTREVFLFTLSLSLKKALLIQACIHSEFSQKGKKKKSKKTKRPFTHLSPFILMIVILTTMSPVFQVFAHSSSLWFSVDLPEQRSQSTWSMSLPAVLNSKGMTPLSFFSSPPHCFLPVEGKCKIDTNVPGILSHLSILRSFFCFIVDSARFL